MSKSKVKDILSSLDKKELESFLLEMMNVYPELENKLIFKYGTRDNELQAAERLILDYIESAEVNGFINWRNAGVAVQGAEIVLNQLSSHIERGNTDMAVSLGLIVLGSMVDLISYCDDSGGFVGEVIFEAAEKIEEAVEKGIQDLHSADRERIFDEILKEAQDDRYDGWSDWRIRLLETCIHFCDDQKLRTILENQLQGFLTKKSEDDWLDSFEQDQLKLIELSIMDRFDDKKKVLDFIEENIQSSPFREEAIMHYLEQDKYEKVIELCVDGEEQDQEYTGLMTKWKKYRFQAYECLGDEQGQKGLAMDLLLHGNHEYLYKLKNLVSPIKWTNVLEEITDQLEKSHYTQVYVRILIEENLTEKLLTYCQENPSEIEHLYKHLMDRYFEEVAHIFEHYIQLIANDTSNRNGYRKVCKVITNFKQACGSEYALQLIGELKEKYGRRPAFLDELSKVM